MTQEDAVQLLECADVFFDADDEMPPHWLNLNDVFAWGCADAEEVQETEMVAVAQMYHHYGWCGILCWVADKRGMTRCEFADINRMIQFVRAEQQVRQETPDSSQRAYRNVRYTLGDGVLLNEG